MAESATVTVGEGVVAVCSNTGVHIARFRPSGDFILLISLPRPPPVSGASGHPAAAFPLAAWAPHLRRGPAMPPTLLTALMPPTDLPQAALQVRAHQAVVTFRSHFWA